MLVNGQFFQMMPHDFSKCESGDENNGAGESPHYPYAASTSLQSALYSSRFASTERHSSALVSVSASSSLQTGKRAFSNPLGA